jgi:hypothetical protein
MLQEFVLQETLLDIVEEDREFGIFLLAGKSLIFFPA